MTEARQRRWTDERGAMLLEFALLTPVLIMLLLGTITLGLAFNRANSLNNGARESARYGATLPISDDMVGWLHNVADVARESATGTLDSSAPDQRICIAYVFPDGTEADDRTFALIEVQGARTISQGATCFDDGRPAGERRVQISMHRTSDIQTGVYSQTIDLDARSVTRFERA